MNHFGETGIGMSPKWKEASARSFSAVSRRTHPAVIEPKRQSDACRELCFSQLNPAAEQREIKATGN